MSGLWLLSIRYLLHRRRQTLVLVFCLSLPVFLPLGTRLVISRYETELGARARGTPLVCGAKGNRFDLAMAALYFRRGSLETVPWTLLQEIQDGGLALGIPLNVRHTARGRPIVGTTPEYFELRRIAAAQGTLPLQLGDVALGSRVAEELALGPGDRLFSDQDDLYDISRPPSLRMSVCGVLPQTGSADDHAVFVSIETTWILEGLVHGHADPEDVEEGFVLGRTKDQVHLNPALMQYQEITPENAHAFHYHGPTDLLPLSSIIVVPNSPKAQTLIKARYNASKEWSMLVPSDVIDELMGFVFRVKSFLDAYSGVLGAVTALMTMLVVVLSMRLRAREMRTLNRIGCSRFTVARVHGTEILLVLVLAVTLAGLELLTVSFCMPDLWRIL